MRRSMRWLLHEVIGLSRVGVGDLGATTGGRRYTGFGRSQPSGRYREEDIRHPATKRFDRGSHECSVSVIIRSPDRIIDEVVAFDHLADHILVTGGHPAVDDRNDGLRTARCPAPSLAGLDITAEGVGARQQSSALQENHLLDCSWSRSTSNGVHFREHRHRWVIFRIVVGRAASD